MTETCRWRNLDRKIVAILRGIQPDDVESIVAGLIDCGFRAIEVPLNSPDVFRSIEIAVKTAASASVGECLIGAGTVYTPEDVERVASCGGNLIVSPNIDQAVIAKTVSLGMDSMPGVFTATEARAALVAGATGLKFFPATVLGSAGINAIRAVLPTDTQICAVGGVGPSDFAVYMASGITGFGLGSSLFSVDASPEQVIAQGRGAVASYDEARCAG